MKFYYLLFLLLVGGLIFLISNPSQRIPQSQEANPITESLGKNFYRIKLDMDNVKEKSVADIVWFKKAAEVAIDKKSPWFNVIEQKISETSVEGIIELIADPMKAEYDANEILSLKIRDEVAQ